MLNSIRYIMLMIVLQNRPNISDELTEMCILYAAVSEIRYLSPRTRGVNIGPKGDPKYAKLFSPHKEGTFKKKIRMSFAGFAKMYAMLSQSSVFDHTDKGNDSELQLLVAFHRFGCYGNGAFLRRIGEYYDISGNFQHKRCDSDN